MRTIWTILSTLAVANLLALAGFIAWLGTSDRLNRERVLAVRDVFKTTVTAEEKVKADEEKQRLIDAKAAEEQARVGQPPLSSDQQIVLADAVTQVAARQQQRLEREASDLTRTLAEEREALQQQREAFKKSVEEFEQRRAQILEQDGDAQFTKTVKLYQSLKAPVAKAMLTTLVRGGAIEDVVAYLNAMQARKASAIIGEFEKDDPAMAADLLERIKKRGTEFDFAQANPTD